MSIWPEIICDDPDMMEDWEALSTEEQQAVNDTQELVDAFAEKYNGLDADSLLDLLDTTDYEEQRLSPTSKPYGLIFCVKLSNGVVATVDTDNQAIFADLGDEVIFTVDNSNLYNEHLEFWLDFWYETEQEAA